jgi:hypothetical protein
MEYRVDQSPLRDRRQTSDQIEKLVRTYSSDLENIKVKINGRILPLSKMPFKVFYDFVRLIPYKKDKAPVEVIGRPAWIIENMAGGIDCKKKAVLISSWLHYHGIPYRLIGSSNRKDKQIHHIFPQAFFSNKWVTVDATYSKYRIGQKKLVTAKEIL